MKTTKEMIEVMQHFEKGGEIESTGTPELPESWAKNVAPTWGWRQYDYRIKEEPKTKTLYFYENPRGIVETFTVKADEQACKSNGWVLVHEIELTPKQGE